VILAGEQLTTSRIREATTEVFSRAHFTRKRSWFDGWELPLPDWSPRVWWTLLAVTLALMVISVIAQRIPQGGYGRTRSDGRSLRRTHDDPWTAAHEFAAKGDYVSALHSLFAALVTALGTAEEVDPHPAKTVGDYERELAARRSAIAAPYRRFAQQYERELYGGSIPDQSSFNSVLALAQPLMARASGR
jgi:hypothetical protein